MRRPGILLPVLLLLLGGCTFHVKETTIEIAAEGEGWSTSPDLEPRADAVRKTRMADVTVTLRADDPYTPVRLLVRPKSAATVTITRKAKDQGVAGAWRLGDRSGKYVGSRVPRPLRFGDALPVPAGTDLLVEFDPGTVGPSGRLSAGAKVEFTLCIRSAGEEESVPVDLKVVDTRRVEERMPLFD